MKSVDDVERAKNENSRYYLSIELINEDGEKERYYVKRFLVENENREEAFISDHKDSQLEIVSTDWKPVAEIEFTKQRGKDRKENLTVNLEEFIAIKGISALGNQLTKEKINQVNLLDPLPYEPPKEAPADEIDVVDVETISSDHTNISEQTQTSKENETKSEGFKADDGEQGTLF